MSERLSLEAIGVAAEMHIEKFHLHIDQIRNTSDRLSADFFSLSEKFLNKDENGFTAEDMPDLGKLALIIGEAKPVLSTANKFFQSDTTGLRDLYVHDVKVPLADILRNSFDFNEGVKNHVFSEVVRVLPLLYNAWAQAFVGAESVFLRGVNQREIEPLDQHGVDVDFILRAVRALQKSTAEKGLVQEKFVQIHIGESVQSIEGSRQIRGNTAAIGNLILNMIRNASRACGDIIDASVDLRLDIEEDEFVVAVGDTGKGMRPDQLNREKPEFILNAGKQSSGEESTGIGLAYADRRVASMGGSFSVISRAAKQGVSEYARYSAKPKDGGELDTQFENTIVDEGQYHGMNTIFELRLPIVEKA